MGRKVKAGAKGGKPLHEKGHFAGIILHGESGAEGNFWFKYENRLDAPLTPKGIEEAERTGEALKRYFKEQNDKWDKIIIECSPFLATMMSAGRIASSLGVKDIVISYRAADFCGEKLET